MSQSVMANTSSSGQPFSRSQLASPPPSPSRYTGPHPTFGATTAVSTTMVPPGCAMLSNLVNEWRKHFIVEGDMLELDYTVITPEAIPKTSGRVDKFSALLCKDPVKDDYQRADHLIHSALQVRIASSRSAAAAVDRSTKLDPATKQTHEDILAKALSCVRHPCQREGSRLSVRVNSMTAATWV